MGNISPTLIDEIYESINEQLFNNYFNYFYSKAELSETSKTQILKKYITKLINDNILNKDSDVILELKANIFREKNRTKKRWLNAIYKEISENKLKTFGIVVQSIKNILEFGASTFKVDNIEVHNVDEYISYIIKILETWENDKTDYISNYKFMSSKSNSIAKKIFELDFMYEICLIIIEKWNGNLQNYIFEIPEMSENAFFSPDKLTIKPDGKIKHDKGVSLYSDFEVDKDTTIRTLLDIGDDNNIKITNFTVLDAKDNMLINFVLSKRNEDFLTDKMLDIDIGEAVKYIFKSDSVKNYKEIEQRLIKISKFNIEGTIEKEGSRDGLFSVNYFEAVKIVSDTFTNKRIARILCTESLRQQYINNQTIKIYGTQIKSFELPLSKILIQIMQKQRIDCYQLDNYKHEYHYSFFKRKIRFKSRKIDVNMDLIQQSLDELISKNVIVKTYKKTIDNSFVIDFIPLSEGEKYDFLGIKNTNILDSDNAQIKLNLL